MDNSNVMTEQEVYEWISFIASKLVRGCPVKYELNDLIGEGYKGYVSAVRHFDPSMGHKFKTFAEFRIKGSIRDFFRKESGIIRSIKFIPKMVSYDEILTDDDNPHTHYPELLLKSSVCDTYKDPFENVENEKLIDALLSLSEKEQDIVLRYYFEDVRMKEIGQARECTESRVSQIHKKAIFKLQKFMNNGGCMGKRLSEERIQEVVKVIEGSKDARAAAVVLGVSHYTPILWGKKYPAVQKALDDMRIRAIRETLPEEQDLEPEPIPAPEPERPSVSFAFVGDITLLGYTYHVDIRITPGRTV